MILYDILIRDRSIGGSAEISVWNQTEYGYDEIFNDNISLLLNDMSYQYLMSYRVDTISLTRSDPVKLHVDDEFIVNYGIRIHLSESTLFSRIEYKCKRIFEGIKKIKRTSNLLWYHLVWLLADKYYLDRGDNWEWPNIDFLPNYFTALGESTCHTEGGEVMLYNADIVAEFGYGRYTQPIFRLKVYRDVDPSSGYIPGPFGRCVADCTMIYTLEPEPKPIYSYETVKKRLRGNIISEKRVDELVQFVKLNYDEIRLAWDTHPSQFGTPEHGIRIDRLVPLDPTIKNRHTNKPSYCESDGDMDSSR